MDNVVPIIGKLSAEFESSDYSFKAMKQNDILSLNKFFSQD